MARVFGVPVWFAALALYPLLLIVAAIVRRWSLGPLEDSQNNVEAVSDEAEEMDEDWTPASSDRGRGQHDGGDAAPTV